MTRQNPRAHVAALSAVICAMVILACSAGSVPTTAPETTAGTTLTPTVAVTQTAAPSPSMADVTPVAAPSTPAATDSTATDLPEPSFDGAPELEHLIPDRVGDITLDEPLGFSGQEYLDTVTGGVPQNIEAFDDFLTRVGGSVEDLAGAATSGFSESGDYVYITANRVAGADPALLLSETVQFNLDSIPNFNSGMAGTATQETVGGKPVTKIVTMLGDSTVYDTSYYYGYGDVIFKVTGISEEVAAEALSLLP